MNDLPPGLRAIEARLRARSHPPLPVTLRQRILAERPAPSSWLGEAALMAAGLILAINAIAVVASRREPETERPSLADLDRQTAIIQSALPDLDPATVRHAAVFAALGANPARFGASVPAVTPRSLTFRLEHLP